MLAYLAAIGFTLALWWSSTVAILYLDRRATHTFARSMAGGTAILLAAIWGVIETRTEATSAAAYLGFACGIAVWGWQLLSFYLGFVTGPRRHACEPGLRGWERFREGVKTSLYHELVAIAFGALLLVLTWEFPNKTALWTYLVLYWMHQSAKLNLFFGALNHGEALLPEQLRYLASFMKRQPMNLLFPVSVTFSTVIAVLLTQAAMAHDASTLEATAFTMLACLMALAVLEHWFLVVPLPVDAMWQWGMSPPQPSQDPAMSREQAANPVRTGSIAQARVTPDEFDSDYDEPQSASKLLHAHLHVTGRVSQHRTYRAETGLT
jgi:putative photosynthetic complex assembly protein 2